MDFKALFKKDISRERAVRLVLLALVPLVCVILAYAGISRYYAVKEMAARKKAGLERFTSLQQEYLTLKGAYDEVANKAFLTGEGSAVSVIESIAEGVGVREKITGLKPLEEVEKLGYMDRGVEARLKGVDLNRLVNLLYRLENHRYLLVIRGFSMKSTFEDPELYDVVLTVSLMSKQSP